MSEGINGILGIKTLLPFPGSVTTVASITRGIIRSTISRVPLHRIEGFKFLRRMTGAPIFRRKRWGGIPGGLREFRNSTG